MDGPIDDDLLAETTDAALAAARSAGAAYAALRVERVRTQLVVLRDGRLETAIDDTEVGTGVQLVSSGSFGFAGTVAVGPAPAAALVADALEAARVTAPARPHEVVLADEPSHGRVEWSSPYVRDPVDVPLADKVGVLAEWSRRLLAAPGIDHVTAYVMAVREDKYLADLSGTVARQRRVRIHPQLEALSVTDGGDFEEMRTLAPPVGRGWEYMEGEGWDFDGELAQLPELLAEKLRAPSVDPGTYDLVVDPTNLWLTIHESIGHATELDRAMGYEAAFAGTSFATPDGLGTLRYGSPVMHVTGDRTTEHGLATVAIDDEGVAAQSFDIVRDGVLVGYQLDRAIAASQRLGRSNGCAFADSPLHTPIQRMANVSLQPAPGDGPSTEELISGVDRGIYIAGDKSWSIDMQRYNFQFTGQRFYAVRAGKLAGQLRDVAYQATTTDFWGAMEAVGGKSTYLLAGAFNCGKGQPEQVAAVSHGCPSVLVRGVRVLNTRQESGR
ncbi:MAG: TldD/PmbA family protein [Actinomycetota bacterium]|nr:TldD/PmbA family protein [Actinomycetota bacterium]